MSDVNKINLIIAKVEILKLKANDHGWQCYVPTEVKAELEKTLVEIDQTLNAIEFKRRLGVQP